jgi:predicted DNA-binding transcriptional regulator AlpA
LSNLNAIALGSAGSALLLSDNTAAAWLDISRATFWRRVADGTLPRPIRLGGATRWRQDELLLAVEKASATREAEAKK